MSNKTYECTICRQQTMGIDIEETFIGLVCIDCDIRCTNKAFGLEEEIKN